MINPDQVNVVCVGRFLTLQLPNQILNSPYCQSYNCYNVGSENWVLDQLIIPKLIFFFFFITYLLDIVLILKGEIVRVTHGNERVKRGIGVNGKKTLFSTVPFYSLFVTDKTPNRSPENHVIPKRASNPPSLDDKMITGCISFKCLCLALT